jgi:cell division protein ZipA
MDTLRIILILGGVLLLLGIYLWEHFKTRKKEEQESWEDIEIESDVGENERIDTSLDNGNPFDDDWEVVPISAHRETTASDDSLDDLKGISAAGSEEDIDENHVAAGATSQAEEHAVEEALEEQLPVTDEKEQTQADEEVIILSLMAGEGTTFNGMQLLDAMELCGLSHGEMDIFHYTDLESGKPLFSVANVLEPGNFDLQSMGELETPGLALFMQLPAPVDGEKALLTFVQQAKRLKEQLSGTLTDSQRRELTRDTLEELKTTARRFRVTPE